MRRRLTLFLAALVLPLAMLALLAPQLLWLLPEGFPAPIWPAPGAFTQIAGTTAPSSLPPGHPPPPAAARRFADSGGRALLMDHGGTLEVEAYGPGITRDTWLNSYSLVKGLVGALTLRAVADGRLPGLDQTLREVLGPDAPDVTLRALLRMTSGFAMGQPVEKPLDDGAFSPLGPLGRLHAFGIEAIMPRLRVDPTRHGAFHYQSVNTALLGLAVARAYDRPLPELLETLIWQPAGAGPAMWRRAPAGHGVSAYCCLYARPVDWLRVGRFLLDNGQPGVPFLPQDLWRDFMAPQLAPDIRRAGLYGLHIRHDVLDRAGEAVAGPFAYFLGHDGQLVYILPEQDRVIIRFGDGPQRLHSTLYELLAPPPATAPP